MITDIRKVFGWLLLSVLVISCKSPLSKTNEKLIYCVNTPFTSEGNGFKFMDAKSDINDYCGVDPEFFLNQDWTTPINYAEGRIEVYMRINNIPVPQKMRTSWNPFQPKENPVEREEFNHYEIGTKREEIVGEPGKVYTWSYDLTDSGAWVDGHDFWVKRRKIGEEWIFYPIDWSKPRSRQSVRFWTADGKREVARGKNWGDENPDEWFPLDITYLVVVVEKGATFSGWDNYVDDHGNLIL